MPSNFDEDDINRLRIALSRTVRALDRGSEQEGVTRTELTVLGTLYRLKSVGLTELAAREAVNPTMLSRIIGKLEDGQMVKRVPDPTDRRAARAEITAAGKRVWERHRKVRTGLLAGLLGDLPPRESAALLAAVPALEALAELARPAEARVS